MNIEVHMFASQWFLTLFTAKFPISLVHHLLDILFFEVINHSVKSVQIQSLFWSVFSFIQSEYRKIRTKKNSLFGNSSRSEYS